MEDVLKTALETMSNLKKPQMKFIQSLLAVLIVFQGKATFTNLSRYSSMSEKRIRRWSECHFDFAHLNTQLLHIALPKDRERIAAIDASFLSKSGRTTEGLAQFYNGSEGKSQLGLEVSTVSITDMDTNTAYALDSRQTIDQTQGTRIDQYVQQVRDLAPHLDTLNIRYLVADAYYSKASFVSKVVELGFHLVGKLRSDADLKWLYQGDYTGRGRPRKFDGKVDYDADLARFEYIGHFNDKTTIHTETMYSPSLKMTVRVVMLRCFRGKKISRTLLFSTDTTLDACKLIEYYKARFQIEFLFRDAKQYTGFSHCQSPRKEAINMQVNASLSALNLLKLEDRQEKGTNEETVISIASWKRRKFNEHLMQRVFEDLGLDVTCKKVEAVYDTYSRYGAIAS